MAFPWLPLLGMTAFGFLAGSQKDVATTEETEGIRLGEESELEKRARANLLNQLSMLQNLAGKRGDFTAADEELQSLAQRYREMAATGGLPSAEQLGSAQGISEQLFAPQAESLRQQFQTQAMDAQRTAAIMGRAGSDPILQAKLAQSQARESSLLQSRQGAEAQRMALQMPGQEMAMRGKAADITQGLAQQQYGLTQQAIRNRISLAGLGSQILGREQQFRYQTGERYRTGTKESGGGLGGAIQGGLSAFGAGASVYKSFQQADYFKGLTERLGQPQAPGNTGYQLGSEAQGSLQSFLGGGSGTGGFPTPSYAGPTSSQPTNVSTYNPSYQGYGSGSHYDRIAQQDVMGAGRYGYEKIPSLWGAIFGG